MAERRWRWRTIIRWTLTIAIVIYAVADWGGDQEKPAPAEPSDEPGAAAALRITAISDADVNPGDAVVVSFDGAEGPAPIEARLARKPAQVIVREPGSVVIRIPSDIGYGKAALRLIQGERRTKSWDLHVRATNHRKLIGRLLGGLALFVFGLGMLATGARGLAGQRIRTLLNRITRSPTRRSRSVSWSARSPSSPRLPPRSRSAWSKPACSPSGRRSRCWSAPSSAHRSPAR